MSPMASVGRSNALAASSEFMTQYSPERERKERIRFVTKVANKSKKVDMGKGKAPLDSVYFTIDLSQDGQGFLQ